MKYFFCNLLAIAMTLSFIFLFLVLILGLIYNGIMTEATAMATWSITFKIALIAWANFSTILATKETYPYFKFIRYAKIIKKTEDKEVKNYYFYKINNELSKELNSLELLKLRRDYLY